MNPFSATFLTPRAIQNARTRIFIPGSDPRFRSTAARPRVAARAPEARTKLFTPPRLFSPGLLDRLHAPLTRYPD